jgi:hypothetical protein
MRPWPALGRSATKKIYLYIHLYIYFLFRYDGLTDVLVAYLLFCAGTGLEERSKTTKGEDTAVVSEKGFEVVSS